MTPGTPHQGTSLGGTEGGGGGGGDKSNMGSKKSVHVQREKLFIA